MGRRSSSQKRREEAEQTQVVEVAEVGRTSSALARTAAEGGDAVATRPRMRAGRMNIVGPARTLEFRCARTVEVVEAKRPAPLGTGGEMEVEEAQVEAGVGRRGAADGARERVEEGATAARSGWDTGVTAAEVEGERRRERLASSNAVASHAKPSRRAAAAAVVAANTGNPSVGSVARAVEDKANEKQLEERTRRARMVPNRDGKGWEPQAVPSPDTLPEEASSARSTVKVTRELPAYCNGRIALLAPEAEFGRIRSQEATKAVEAEHSLRNGDAEQVPRSGIAAVAGVVDMKRRRRQSWPKEAGSRRAGPAAVVSTVTWSKLSW